MRVWTVPSLFRREGWLGDGIAGGPERPVYGPASLGLVDRS